MSIWKEVSSGALQESVLASLLVNTFMNELEDGIDCMVNKLTDETKLGRAVVTLENRIQFQNNLDRLKK